MTDTTKTPDEPDGYGAVSTGGRAVPAGGEGAVARPGGNGSAGGDGEVPESGHGNGHADGGSPRPSPGPRMADGGLSGRPGGAGGAANPVLTDRAGVPSGGATEPDAGAPSPFATKESAGAPAGQAPSAPSVPDVDAPTVTAPTVTAPTVTAPTVTAPTVTAPTVTAPTVTAPVPASGPVPTPGPGAAAPPPWRRMPDHDAAPDPGRGNGPEAAPAPDPHAATATDLLDDVPTAFVEPAGVPDDSAPAPAAGRPSAPPADRAGWSSMRTRVRPPRRAALQLKRLDPWSVLKLALVLAGVLFLIWMVAVGLLYGVLDGMGVWDRLNGTYSDLVSGGADTGGQALISAWRVFGYSALIGLVNSVLLAVAMTVSAFIYNVCADLVGGIEVTLSERD